ncbi:tyrosine-protein phosphatase [Microbacterium hominis]|nr:tyrosine-protein phosphatase [Microbacterium hominis]
MLDGTFNFRDVGGLPAGEGRVRRGVLYRSDALGGLTAAGLEMFARTPIGTVVDLRTQEEVDQRPDRLPGSREIELVHLPLLEGMARDAATRVPTLPGLYRQMAAHAGGTFARIAQYLTAEVDGRPEAVLVHCTAGKDRTGIAVAVLLDAAGADRDAILEDYASSGPNLAGEWAESMFARVRAMGVEVTPELEVLLAGSPVDAIDEALGWIDRERGGSAAYLAASGLSEPALETLRARLIDS